MRNRVAGADTRRRSMGSIPFEAPTAASGVVSVEPSRIVSAPAEVLDAKDAKIRDLRARLVTVEAKLADQVEQTKTALVERDHYRHECGIAKAKDVWRWQGDGTDNQASMGARMAVVMSSATLRELIDRSERAERERDEATVRLRHAKADAEQAVAVTMQKRDAALAHAEAMASFAVDHAGRCVLCGARQGTHREPCPVAAYRAEHPREGTTTLRLDPQSATRALSCVTGHMEAYENAAKLAESVTDDDVRRRRPGSLYTGNAREVGEVLAEMFRNLAEKVRNA